MLRILELIDNGLIDAVVQKQSPAPASAQTVETKDRKRVRKTQDSPEGVLGMAITEVLSVWRGLGSPGIPLGPGETCLDLEKLLSNNIVNPRHLQKLQGWLMEVRGSQSGLKETEHISAT